MPLKMQLYRVYICYILTTLLISVFVFCLISNNLQTMKKMDRLREEVDDIAHLILEPPYNGKTESKYLTDLIDKFIKKRLAGIWDDLNFIKKEIKSKDCAATIAQNSKTQTKKAIEKFEERVNFAAEELGAHVLNVQAEPINSVNFLQSWLNMDFSTNPPILMLRSSMVPGSCFGFRNNMAAVTIKLFKEVVIDQILVQHITKKQSPNEDISSAPKHFELFGLRNEKETFLGSFIFNNSAASQYFSIRNNERFQIFQVKFLSNHGHPNFTCVYKVALYGEL